MEAPVFSAAKPGNTKIALNIALSAIAIRPASPSVGSNLCDGLPMTRSPKLGVLADVVKGRGARHSLETGR